MNLLNHEKLLYDGTFVGMNLLMTGAILWVFTIHEVFYTQLPLLFIEVFVILLWVTLGAPELRRMSKECEKEE